MTELRDHSMPAYREQIVNSLTAVRPLSTPARRVWLLVPVGLLLAGTAPLLSGLRGDLAAATPVLTWGVTALQSLLGLWLLALAFRESIPGRNLSRRELALASAATAILVTVITLLTSSASATVVPPGRAFQYWIECVGAPVAIAAPFLILSTLMTARAFPTRPALAGALCGTAAGVLTDAGWRLSCWISEPAHVLSSHGLAILGLALLGAVIGAGADRPRWRRLRSARVARSAADRRDTDPL